MPTKPPVVNTFELQRAIRDDRSLSSSDKLTLHTLATYLPTVHPSIKTLARGAALDIKTVRRSIKRLVAAGWLHLDVRPGRTTLYTLTPAKRHPYQTAPVVPNGCTQTAPVHPYQTAPPEETRKRQDQDKTRQDTEISHVTTPSEEPVRPAGQVDKGEAKTSASDTTTPSTPRSAAQKLAAWSDVWVKVLGPKAGPLPSVAQLKAWRADCTEAIFSSTLADVASSVAQGKVSEPRALFRANLRSADPKAPAWTKEQVCAIVDPSAPTPRPASRNPAYQPVVVRERQRPMNAEEKKAAMALIAKARRELMGEGATA